MLICLFDAYNLFQKPMKNSSRSLYIDVLIKCAKTLLNDITTQTILLVVLLIQLKTRVVARQPYQDDINLNHSQALTNITTIQTSSRWVLAH